MKRISIFLLLISLSIFAQAEKNTAELSDGTKCNYETKNGIMDGEYKSYYKNGRLKCEGSFLQNNRFGFWVFYKPDGSIQCLRDYKNNYQFEEKTADNKTKKVSWNENNNWTMIKMENVISRSRNHYTVLRDDNMDLFNNEKIAERVLRIAKGSSKEIYADHRFVKPASKDILNHADIIGFQIQEDRILDRVTGMLHYRIVGIAPLVISNETKKLTELCWIHYDDIKNEFAKIKLTNSGNTLSVNTMLDIFEKRNYFSKPIRSNYMNPPMSQEMNNDLQANPLITDIELENTLITNNFIIK